VKRRRMLVFLYIIFALFYCAAPAIATTKPDCINIGSLLPQKVVTTLLSVLTLILVDTVLGILASLKMGQFDLRKLPQFLSRNVLPFIGALG